MPTYLRTSVHETFVLTALPAGHLDDERVQAIKQELTTLVQRVGDGELRLEFAVVESVSSTALGMLVAASRKLNRAGGHLVLCNVADHLVRLFALTRLDSLLDIRPRCPGIPTATRILA